MGRKTVGKRLPDRNNSTPLALCATRTGGNNSAAFTRGLGTAPHALEVVGVDLIPSAAVGTEAANFWTFELRNGATVLASFNTSVATGSALTAETAQALTLSSTLADLKVGAGDQLDLVATPASAGNGADLSAVEMAVSIRYQPTGL